MRAALLLLLPLAACSAGDADYNRVEVPEREAAAQAAIDRSVAQNGMANTARTGVPVTAPTRTAARSRAFPREFHGYWGRTPDDCELANTNALGRINIDADRIRFHESNARVTDVVRASAWDVTVDLRFSGEGETWERRDTFSLENGGTAMLRREPGVPDVRYQRC